MTDNDPELERMRREAAKRHVVDVVNRDLPKQEQNK